MNRQTLLKVVLIMCLLSSALKCWGGDFYLGVGTHIWGQDGNKNIRYIKELQLNAVRDDVLWDKVEVEKGKISIHPRIDNYFRGLEAINITPVFVLAYGNPYYDGGKKPTTPEGLNAYSIFASSVAKKLKGRKVFYEIWNEYDHSAPPTSPQSYVELLKAAASAIKSADPNAKILAGAATAAAWKSGWVDQLVSLGALQYADGISVHPYIHCDRDNSPEAWIRFVSDASKRLNQTNSGKEVPLYFTEMGWPSHNGACGTTPETVADNAARSLLLVRTVPEVKGFWWYDIKNDGNNIENREHNFGLMNYDYSYKPAFAAFRDVSKYVVNATSVERMASPRGVVLLRITDKFGKKAFALWGENGNNIEASLSIVRDRSAIPLILKAGTGKSVSIAPNSNLLTVKLDGKPQIITGLEKLQISGN